MLTTHNLTICVQTPWISNVCRVFGTKAMKSRILHFRARYYLGSIVIFGKQGVAQWWARSPPTNVARVQIPASTPYVGSVCCWFSPLFREVFLRVLRFSPSSKTNISKFQFDQESGRRRTTLWMCYLQITTYLFILFIYYENSFIPVNGEEITYIKRALGWL